MSKTSSSKSIKNENTRLVMEKLIEHRRISRVELARLTTLNKATISSIINELLERKLVLETDERVKTSGRSAKVLELNKNAGRIISLDLMAKSLYGVIANLYGDILYEINVKVDNTNFKNYLKIILEAIDTLRENTYESIYGLIGIGIGVYGILSNDRIIKYAPFNNWKDIDLASIVENYTKVKTHVENEANISALGEHVLYKETSNLVTLNIGLGVGIGIIINDNLYRGELGFAGEFGHTIIVPNGRKCICGNHGCLETYISDSAIIDNYYNKTHEIINLSEFISRYKSNDKFAQNIFDEFTGHVAIAVNNISQTLNPEILIINSELINQIPEGLSDVKNKLSSTLMRLNVISKSTYEFKANIHGLVHILIQEFLDVENYKVELNL